MDLECPLCGEKAIMHDYHGSDEQFVCAECGYVVESAGMVSFAYDPSKGDMKQFVSSTRDPSFSYNGPGYKSLINYLEMTVQLMKLSPEVEELSKQYFEKTYGHEQIKEKSIDYKEVLVIACLYLSCRQHNSLYTLLEMARMTKRNMFELGRAYKTVVQLLNLKLEHAAIGTLSRNLFSQCQLPFSVVKCAHQLLNIGEKFWLVSGRNPVGLLSAVAYISWKAEKPAERCKISAWSFCHKHSLVLSTMVKKRVNEIEDILCHLALQLPWIKTKPNREKLSFLLPDILNYQHTLFNNMLLKCKHEKKKAENFEESKEETDNKEDASYGEILPPIMKKPRKRKMPVNVECISPTPMYSDDDLENLNVDEYIRTEKEVELMKKLQTSNDSFKQESSD